MERIDETGRYLDTLPQIALGENMRLIFVLIFMASAASAKVYQTSAGPVNIEPMVNGLDEPWAIGVMPDGAFLITERDGRIIYLDGQGSFNEVDGEPEVWNSGQGGLLDLVIARDFEETRTIFLTYSKPINGLAATAVATARLSDDAKALENLTDIFVMNRPTRRGQHFGSRIVEAEDGTLWVTLGERGDKDQAQNLDTHNGTVIRINRDGTIPDDNPFIDGVAPEIWSYGHRNPQGAAMDADGVLWTVEHGAQGGDEINRPEAGLNYGWPVITYGKDYDNSPIGIGTEADGMEQPLFYWDPSIAPSGMMIYSGKLFPDWEGDIFVGALKFSYISRLEVNGDQVTEAEELFRDEFIRIRDVREAPDGSIWFLSVGDGTAYRMTPAE